MSDSNNPYGVRRANSADAESLRVLVPLLVEETTLLPPSPTKIEMLIERCCGRRSGAFAGVINGLDGAIDASVGMAFTDSETSDEPYLAAVWFGLAPHARRKPSDPNDPRAHYGKRLFDFARWCHAGLEEAAGHPILVRFDVLTRQFLGPKMGLYQRNLMQVGASFAFGAAGAFVSQEVPEEVAA